LAKRRIKSTLLHHPIGEEDVCVGEFHYGSASDQKILPPGKGIKLFLTDPPYNLGFDYGEVTDNQPEEEYHQMMEDIFDSCYEAADEDAHLFIIHYAQDLAKMWPRLTKKWNFHQWITWNYPANFGHSSKKWTNASRTILWLTKGDPEFYGERVVQPYRNPTDKRIKKLIHEDGKIGTNLYNWWQVNLCKNVSKDKKDYSNQIPEALLERIILSTTNLGDKVADPFSGTFSTSRTALRLGRYAWGCDLNPDVVQWRPTIDEFVPNPEIPEQQYDQEYPFYKIQEAGLTEEQFEKITTHLYRNITPDELANAPGIGIKKAKDFVRNMKKKPKSNTTLFDFGSGSPDDVVASAPKISLNQTDLDGQTELTKSSKEIREKMIQRSLNWPTGVDESKEFTESGDKIGDVALEYGKPGKFASVKKKASNYKPEDMQPRINSKPEWKPDAWELYAPLAELWLADQNAAKEVNSLLMKIAWCKTFKQDPKDNYVLSLTHDEINRINEIDEEFRDCFGQFTLPEIILFIESIARTDDVNQYIRNKDKVKAQSGRILYVKTTIACAKAVAEAIDDAESSQTRSLAKFINDLARSGGMITIKADRLVDYVYIS